MRLEGKVAVITGAARGLGEAQARLLAREGARIALADVLENDGKQVEAAIKGDGGEAFFIKLDVTDEEAAAESRSESSGWDAPCSAAEGPSQRG